MISLLISLSKEPPKAIKSTYLKPVLIFIFNDSLPKKIFTQDQKKMWDFIRQENKKRVCFEGYKKEKISIIGK